MSDSLDLSLPTVALTMGDPSGIGPEIIAKALNDATLHGLAKWVVIGDRRILQKAAEVTGFSLDQAIVRDIPALYAIRDFTFGKLDGRYGEAAVEYVRAATEMCLAGEADAMVTAPLNKEAVTLSGRPFSGHTEYIAQLCGASESRMLLRSARLSTIHVSTHVPLRRACNLDTARILRTIELGHAAMQLLGLDDPRIAVCGLNPHAGEHGLFGNEDEQLIAPAVTAARGRGFLCTGPHAGDTVFLQGSRGAYDLIVAMYHDQGHIPMKLIDFEGTVNISVGIPIIRTSVDHGTAFDIAGKNQADPHSMIEAMKTAALMARTRAGAASHGRKTGPN